MRMRLSSQLELGRPLLDGGQSEESIVFQDRTLVAHHDDASASFGLDLSRFATVERVNDTEQGAFADFCSQLDGRNKKTVFGSRVVNLQMGFLGIIGNTGFLSAQGGRRATGDSRPTQQIFETAIQRREVSWSDTAGSSAFDVDRRYITCKGRAQSATGQRGGSPAPKIIKAGGHFTLGFANTILSDGKPDPRKQFISGPTAMQINIVGDLGYQLSVKQVRETGRGISARIAGESPSEVATIPRMAAIGGVKGGLIQNRNHDNGAAKLGGSPLVGPLSQQCRSFIFIAMSGSVEQQYGAGTAAPDPSIKANLPGLESAAVEAGGKGAKIET